MKKNVLLILFLSYTVLTQAQLLFGESFNYSVNSGLIGLGEWTNDATSTSNPITVTSSTPLTHSGYASSAIGNEVSLTSTGQDVSHVFSAQTSGIIYFSVLVNISSAKSGGDYFIHLVSSSAHFGRVFVKLDGSKLAFGILNAAGGSYTPTYTASIYELNTTYLLIVKVDVSTGTSSLIVNPGNLSSEPTIGWISSSSPANGGMGGTAVPTNSGIGKINLRQGDTSTSPILKLDEIRIATSYSSTITSSCPHYNNLLNITLTGKKLTVANSSVSTVEIFNSVGVKVKSVELINGSADLTLSKGLYIVRAGKASGKILF